MCTVSPKIMQKSSNSATCQFYFVYPVCILFVMYVYQLKSHKSDEWMYILLLIYSKFCPPTWCLHVSSSFPLNDFSCYLKLCLLTWSFLCNLFKQTDWYTGSLTCHFYVCPSFHSSIHLAILLTAFFRPTCSLENSCRVLFQYS